MIGLLNTIILPCILLAQNALAAPVEPHKSGGAEHVVIIDKNQDLPPRYEEVLERLALREDHDDVHRIFNNSAFVGFAADMTDHCLGLLANMSDVSLVEPTLNVMADSMVERQASRFDHRANAPWGLQRISTASNVVGDAETIDFTYAYANEGLGSGADIYILDTGIYTEHSVFDGRAEMLWSFDDQGDTDGHGTHVAGTAGGATFGVASNASIFGLRALDSNGGGMSSNVVAAIDFVVNRHDERKNDPDYRGAVVSLSLAAEQNVQSIDSAITAATRAGVHVCVAAGNSGRDACASSPSSAGGSHGGAISVGAVDMANRRSDFSNYGDCVDVYAPGENIISAWIGAPNMINSLDGTSMATPHVTGIVAYAMANATLAQDPKAMKQWVRDNAVRTADGTLLANNGVHEESDAASVSSEDAPKLVGRPEKRSADAAWVAAQPESLACRQARQRGEGAAWVCGAKRMVRRAAAVLEAVAW